MKRIIYWLLVARYWLGCIFYRYEVAVPPDGMDTPIEDWLDEHSPLEGWGILLVTDDVISLYRTVPRWSHPAATPRGEEGR